MYSEPVVITKVKGQEYPLAQAKVKTRIRKTAPVLKASMFEDPAILEIGVDEVGRGPLFGRVYTAAVILPNDGSFDCSMVKDSKKFHSKKKIMEAAEYIKLNALKWAVSFAEAETIDRINILQATQQSMHDSINNILDDKSSYHILVDGNYFNPFIRLNDKSNVADSSHFPAENLVVQHSYKTFEQIPHTTVEKGDDTYASIAAASILAKVQRDKYIEELCLEHPEWVERYGLDSNKGYGTQKHIDGIKQYGITEFHRKSFATCKGCN